MSWTGGRRLAFAAAAATACGGDTPRSGTAADSAAPSDSSAERPLGSSPDRWTVTAEGYGPIRIGMSADELRGMLGPLLVPRDSLAPECDYLALGPESPEVLFMIVGRQLVRLDVRDSTVATEAGARIGDSEANIGRLYGADRVMSTPHAYTDGHYLTVAPSGAGDDHRLVFETDGKAVTEYRAGLLPMVGWVEGCS